MQVNRIVKYMTWLLFLLAIRSNATPLSGTYTINASASATATNFKNFFSANAYLTGGTRNDGGPNNSAPFGVSGPVMFNVAAGTYNEQFNLSGTIAGVSPVNTITYDGGNGNASSRIIAFSATSSSFPTLVINNVPYVTIRNLTINATDYNNGFGVQITGTSNCCRVNHCNINLATPSSMVYNLQGINIGGTGNYWSASARIDSLQIDSNIIYGGFYGIVFSFNSGTSNPCIQNKFRNNLIVNYYNQGIYLSYQNGLNILNNRLIPAAISSTYSGGISLDHCNNNGVNPTIISGNKISNMALAIQIYSSNNAPGNKGFITNNMCGGGLTGTYYLYSLQYSNNWSIANNSFNYDIVASVIAYSPLFLANTSGISVMNNIFSVKQNGTSALPVNIPSTNYIDSMDYNIFYRQDTSDHQLIVLGTAYNTGNFKGGGGFNQHSQFLNPGFVSDIDLHTTAPCVRGISLPYVTNDIDGNPRNSPPNFGASEVQRFSNDIATSVIVSPIYPIANGAQNLRVRVVNSGSNTVFSFNLSYKLNGNSPITQSWSGILNPCDTVSILFSGLQQMTVPSGANTLKIYTSQPNYTTDANMLNDTLTSSFLTAMSGTYIIGTPPSDYTTFTAAISDLNLLGIGRSVKFLVKTGTFYESLTVTTPTGASTTNTVSFNSIANNRDSVIVYYSGGYVMNLSASYFSFNHISFNQTAPTGNVLNLNGTPSFDTIYDCKLITPNTNGNSSNVIYANGVTLSNFVLRKNIIQGGYYNLNIVSSPTNYSDNIIIDSNILQNTYYSTALAYFTNLKFRNNPVNINYNNLFFTIQYSNTGYEFSGNHINVTPGLTATMFLSYYCSGTSGNRIKINNNMFTAGATASINLYAPYYYAGYVDFYNNSMVLGNGFLEIGYNSNDLRCYYNSVSSDNINGALLHNESGNSNIEVKNNVIAKTSGGVAVYWINTPSASTYDYNNFYTTGPNLISVNSGATNYPSLSAWRGAYNTDKNSLSYVPGFTNITGNLAPNNSDLACWSLNGRGLPVSWITSDINGNLRSSQISTGATDIGAFEFTPTVNPPFAIASPAAPVAASTQYFTFGFDTLAAIVWGTSVPSNIQAQLFSGTNAPEVGSGTFYRTNVYYNISSPTGTYDYNLKLYYKDNWLGTIPGVSNMVITQKSEGSNWGIASASHTIDSINNIMTSNGLTHFSYFTGTDATSPLPVKLLNFTAKKINHDVNLSWTTASEMNNDYFEVERSTDLPAWAQANGGQAGNSQWSTVGKVKGNGTTNSKSNYGYIDNISNLQYLTSNIFYRLKQTDFDGTSEYSNMIAVHISNILNPEWSISPNPVRDRIIILSKQQIPKGSQIIVFDMLGKKVLESIILNDNTDYSIPCGDLKPGTYFLTMKNGEEPVRMLFMKE